MGIELASHILAGALLGWLLDKLFNTTYWLMIGSIAGLIVGMVDFIRSALKAQRQAAGPAATRRHRDAEAPGPDAAEEQPDQQPNREHDGSSH